MTNNQFDDIIEIILDERNDRALIILCSSLVDDLLYLILSKHFLDPLKGDENLLKGDNPLTTFSSRIKMIYRLGIIDESLLSILDKLRDIRNKCAHNIDVSVNKPPLKDKLSHLHKLLENRDSYKLTQKRYVINEAMLFADIKLIFIAICVILKAIYDSINTLTHNSKLINISKK
ncbi:hypothetical protein [Flavobacterium sp.]